MQINGNFCGLVLNQPLGGLHVIEGLPLLADSSDGMASVAAYTYRQHSVVFIGTRNGSLKKVGRGLGQDRALRGPEGDTGHGGRRTSRPGPGDPATLHGRLLGRPHSPAPVPAMASIAGCVTAQTRLRAFPLSEQGPG